MNVSAPVRRAYLDVSGRQMHYRTAGQQGLPRLLLLHQSPSSSAMYQALMQQLADRYQVFAPDTPGFGNSDPLPVAQHALQIADYASAIHDFCSALGLEGCYVFGHHTGAAVAVQLEHDYPGTAQAMVLSGPTLLTAEQKISLPESKLRRSLLRLEGWQITAGTALAVAVVIFTALWFRPPGIKPEIAMKMAANEMLEAESFMDDISTLTENALPEVYLDITGESYTGFGEDFMQFVVPNINESAPASDLGSEGVTSC